MIEFIDYSQYRTWYKCPWAWYWRYVKGFRKKFPDQRKDALCLGSLVHDGLENWIKLQRPTISDEVIAEMTPTPECLSAARDLVEEYVRLYPNEEWEIHRVEEPIRFGLEGGRKSGLAKVDAYFYNPEQREVETGLENYQISLEPGWWIREYKTKDATQNRAYWNQNWEVNMQAAFQMLALKELIGEVPQGILVSVLEKPRMYIPKRKCKGSCGETLEMGLYLFDPNTGLHACPMCGTAQKLSPYEPKVASKPQFYRLVARRNEDQLRHALDEIQQVANQMLYVEQENNLNEGTGGQYALPPNRENCVHPIYGNCEFYKVDTYGIDPSEDELLEAKDPFEYLQLEEPV